MRKMCKEKKAIVISNPVPATNNSGLISLNKFVKILEVLFDDISIISGNLPIDGMDCNKTRILPIKRKRSNNSVLNIIFYICFQIEAGLATLIKTNSRSKVFFWIGDGMILPFYISLLRKAEIYYFVYGNPVKIRGGKKTELGTARRIIKFANKATYVCAEDEKVFDEWNGQIINPRRKVIHLYTESPVLNCKKNNVIGMICRISEGKYVLESIRAFEVFCKTHPDWKLEIIGSGTQKEQCEEYISNHSLSDKITMFGWIDPDSKWEIMKYWRYLLFPTDTEGLPNTLLETMSIGVPSICSPVSSIASLVADGENGIYIRENTSEGIFEAIEIATDIDEKRYSDFLNACIDTIKQEYTFVRALDKAQQVINDE